MEPTFELIQAARKYTQDVTGHTTLLAYKTLNIIDFIRDFDLNIVCGDNCIEETLKCY